MKKTKKMLASLLLLTMVGTSLAGCGGGSSTETTSASAEETEAAGETGEDTAAETEEETSADMDALIKAAQEEGELVVYGSCEEPYVKAAAQNFEKLYGIKTTYQRLSTGEVEAKVKEENGNPSADVWFGGTTDPYNVAINDGILEPYEAMNAVHLKSEKYRDPDGYWYGIYTGYLGFMVNKEELDAEGLEAPMDWDDLIKPEYKGMIAYSNPGTAGTGKLIVNTMVQMKGEEAAMEYFKELDKNIQVYTKAGAGPSKMVGPGEILIAVGFLHDGVTQILDGYDNIELIAPASGTSYEIGATAIFKGAKHPNAAKLWIEYALSPDCVELGQTCGSYQFLVIDNAQDPECLADFPELQNAKLIDYDFEAAKNDTTRLVEEWNQTINADDRLETE